MKGKELQNKVFDSITDDLANIILDYIHAFNCDLSEDEESELIDNILREISKY